MTMILTLFSECDSYDKLIVNFEKIKDSAVTLQIGKNLF